VNFKHAWGDPTTGVVFCLSEAPNAEAVKRIHERAGHPTDEVYEGAAPGLAGRRRAPIHPPRAVLA
jgi:hypothetical protein